MKKKYAHFKCGNCGIGWTKEKTKDKTDKCKKCNMIIYRMDYYYFYCKDCIKTWRAYVTTSPHSKCTSCGNEIKLCVKKN